MYMLTVSSRDLNAQGRTLRHAGIVPGCIYGKQLPETLPIQMTQDLAEGLLRNVRIGGQVELELNGKKFCVVIQNIDRNTILDSITHIGFLAAEVVL